LAAAVTYFEKWLRSQSVWDLQLGKIEDVPSDNLGHLFELLMDIRKTISTFDTTDVRKSFGSIFSDYGRDTTKGKGYMANRLQHRLCSVESLAVLILSVLPAASYIYTKLSP